MWGQYVMAIDNGIRSAVLPLVSNYVCVSREFDLINKAVCQCLPFYKGLFVESSCLAV